jgi:4-amino-4-deoxy-L-arabinose transferase-like glycosyltransferase
LTALCLAFGTLTKNPIGFAVPLLAIVTFILVTRDFQLIMETKPWWLLALFLLIVLPWFILVYLRIPNFSEILKQETLARYVDPESSPHYEPFYYYLLALRAFSPWVIFLPGMIISLVTKHKPQLSRMHLFLIIACVTTFGLFSSVGSKREYYLLPLYPLLAILVAKYWDEYTVMKKTTTQRWTWKAMDIPIVGFAGLLCFVGPGLPVVAALRFPQYIKLSLVFGPLILGSGILIFWMFFRRDVVGIFGISSAATILLYLLAIITIGPEMDAYRSRKKFFHEVAAIVGDHLIVDYNFESYTPQFYMQRIIPILHEVNELQDLFSRDQPVYVFTTGPQYENLQHEYPQLIEQFQLLLDRTWTSALDPKRQRRLVLLKTKSHF